MSDFTLSTFMNFMTPLLTLRYPDENPFLTQPKKMFILVSSSTLHYLLHLGPRVFPRSSFFAKAKQYLTPFSACTAISSLLAALFPDPCATAFIYTIFTLLVAGHVLYKLDYFKVEDNQDGIHADQTWYQSFVTTCRRYKTTLARSVAAFFEDQTPPSLVQAHDCIPIAEQSSREPITICL